MVAAPGPLLVTVIVKPMLLPALTVAASAVLLIWSAGHWTVVVAEAVIAAWLSASAVAVFG